MTQKKRYVVWKGKKRGIFNSRDQCKDQVHGFNGSQYKSFESLSAAEKAFSGTYSSNIKYKTKIGIQKKHHYIDLVEHNSISVDAACSNNPGILEWQCVETISGLNLFSSSKYQLGTVNVGEWIALVQGMRLLHEKNRKENIIYSDSLVALGRVTKGIIKTTLPQNQQTKELRSLIDENLTRLIDVGLNLLDQKKIILLKRKTKERGEIPADYGRK